jgi:hypothetical protein
MRSSARNCVAGAPARTVGAVDAHRGVEREASPMRGVISVEIMVALTCVVFI